MGSKSASPGSPIGGSASPNTGNSPQPAMPYGQQQFTPPNPQYPAMNPQYPSPSPQYPTAIPQRPYLNPQDANLRQLASGYRPSNQNLRQVAQQLRAQQPQPVLRPPMMYDPGPSQQPPSVINPPMMYDPGPQFNGGSSPVTHPQNPASPANVYKPQQQANRPVNVVHNMNWQRENNALPAPHPYVPRPQPINPNNPKAPPPGPDMPITTPGAPDMPGGGGLPLPGIAGLFSSGGTIGRPSWKKGGSVHSHDDIDNALRVAKLQFGGTPALRQGPTLQQSAVTPMTYDRAGYAFGGDAFASSTGSTASAPSASGAASTSGAPAATPSTPSSAGNAPQAGSQSQDSNSSPDNGTHVEAPMYLNMNNPMDNMMAQGQTGFARGGQVHMEEGGDPEAQQQETPDYDRASQFEQQQLQSGEPQVPQTNKQVEALTENIGNKALAAGKLAAYMHPATRGAMGIYDLAHGVRTGNPSEMAASLFAIPNRAAKAIAAAGMSQQPENPGHPAARFIREAYGAMADGGKAGAYKDGKYLPYQQTQTPSSKPSGSTTPQTSRPISPNEYKKGNLKGGEYVMAKGGLVEDALRIADRQNFRKGGIPYPLPPGVQNTRESLQNYINSNMAKMTPAQAYAAIQIAEAGNQKTDQSRAIPVLNVMNRAASGFNEGGAGRLPVDQRTDPKAQIMANGQFTSMTGQTPKNLQVGANAIHNVLNNPNHSQVKQANDVLNKIGQGNIQDFTNGSTQYAAPGKAGNAYLNSMRNDKNYEYLGQSGAHQFFSNKNLTPIAKANFPNVRDDLQRDLAAAKPATPAPQTPASGATPTTTGQNMASLTPQPVTPKPAPFTPQQQAPVKAPDETSTQNFLKDEMSKPEPKDFDGAVTTGPNEAKAAPIPEPTPVAEAPATETPDMPETNMAGGMGSDDIDTAADGGVIKPHYEYNDGGEVGKKLLHHALKLSRKGYDEGGVPKGVFGEAEQFAPMPERQPLDKKFPAPNNGTDLLAIAHDPREPMWKRAGAIGAGMAGDIGKGVFNEVRKAHDTLTGEYDPSGGKGVGASDQAIRDSLNTAMMGLGTGTVFNKAPRGAIGAFANTGKRIDELKEAAKNLGSTTTKEGYQQLVNELKPPRPYESVPAPATHEEITNAVNSNMKEKVGLGHQIPEGHPVGLRLDIPAYTRHGVWVPTIHDKATSKVLAYDPVAHITDAEFGMQQNKALKIAQGGEKSPFAKIHGSWKPTSPEEAHAMASEYLNHPDWRQVGMDPTRHSYFYDRASQEPITHAEEVLQVGPLVLAKKPVYGSREDFHYAKGGDVEHE